MLDNTGAFRYNTGIVNILRFLRPFLEKRALGNGSNRNIRSCIFFRKNSAVLKGSKAKLRKLEDELHDLKVVKRKEVAGKIKEAREQGDLSENAEYDAAKDEQRDIEARIEEIEKILKNAEVVVEDEVDLDRISVGCKVKVHDYEFEEDMELKIVGSTEANSL